MLLLCAPISVHIRQYNKKRLKVFWIVLPNISTYKILNSLCWIIQHFSTGINRPLQALEIISINFSKNDLKIFYFFPCFFIFSVILFSMSGSHYVRVPNIYGTFTYLCKYSVNIWHSNIATARHWEYYYTKNKKAREKVKYF